MILPGATLGLLGGGQLGLMFTVAARRMGYRVACIDPDPQAPAAGFADIFMAAAYDDAQALQELARTCAAVTAEFENVPAASLEYLAAHVPVRPSARAFAITQDRAREKTFLRQIGLPTARFEVIARIGDLEPALERIGLPVILKTTRQGYDGKGQRRVASLDGARCAFVEMGGAACVAEEEVALDREVSVVLARSSDGEVRDFAVTENWHRDGILDVSLAPARVDGEIARRAVTMATGAATRMEYCGVLAVEFFVTQDGRLLINELAPRPHNSGHWTLDAAATSQFEQQVRALCGVPLGSARQMCPAAMGNLLGDLWRDGKAPPWERILERSDAKLHLYGKKEARRGRKMGHFTCLGESPEAVLAEVRAVKASLAAAVTGSDLESARA